jgi:hypothetical protein
VDWRHFPSASKLQACHQPEITLRPQTHRLLIALPLALHLTGCQVWHVAGPTPAAFIQDRSPDRILVHRTDGSPVELLNPSVEGDSLRGFALTGGTSTLALANVQSVSVRGVSWSRTLGLVGAVGAGIALAALLSSCSGSSDIYC